ncbi:MAG: MATE family efflux transporter [Betaproteobacteria bacterium]|nr:MATE family efflux transporter [Betaproteobacteria bacterium]
MPLNTPLFPLSRRIATLAWPVLAAQVASIGMALLDTLIVGRYSTGHLAAVALGGGIYVTLMLGMAGILMALGPIIGQDYGAGRREMIGASVRDGFWLAALLALAGFLLLSFPRQLLALAQLEPELEAIAASYLYLLAFSLPAALGYRVFHATANALGYPLPLMYIALAETLLHALLAWALVGGLPVLSLPALGANGAALSQIIVNWLAFLVACCFLARHSRFSPYRIFSVSLAQLRPRLAAQKALLRLGLPMGLSYLVEVSAFTLMAFFIARIGVAEVSAYRIAANVSALTYMLPLSLATATAVLVAQAVGAGNERLAVATISAGQVTGIVLALGGALLLYLLRFPLARLATVDAQVIEIVGMMVVYIAAYQFFDSIQTIAAFSLRAYKISFIPLCIHLGCFWGLGIGFGFWLAFHAPTPQGAMGFWQATVLATVAASFFLGGLLLIVVKSRLRQEVSPSLTIQEKSS